MKSFTMHSCKMLLALCTLMLTACDEGDIQPKTYNQESTGQAIHLTAHLEGVESWNSKYDIALASFGASSSSSSNYSISQRSILPSMLDENGNIDITLENVTSPAQTVELCVTDQIRQRVATFASLDLKEHANRKNIEWNLGTIPVGIYATIQDNIFNQFCIACHGDGGLAAGLNLKADVSYQQLVQTPSHTVSGATRVRPGRAASSLLYQVLNSRSTDRLNRIHGNIIQNAQDVSSSTLTTLITDWINDGAQP